MKVTKDMVPASGRFWTASNMLSLSRVALSIPFVLIMLGGGATARWWGLALMIVGAATDKLDGLLARKWNEVSEWGKILDPLADKIALAAVGIVLYFKHELPDWFLGLILGRDLLIFLGGLFIRSRLGIVLQSNTAGKWTVGVIGATFLLKLLQIEGWLVLIGTWGSVVMILISLAAYVGRFIEVLRVREGVHGHS